MLSRHTEAEAEAAAAFEAVDEGCYCTARVVTAVEFSSRFFNFFCLSGIKDIKAAWLFSNCFRGTLRPHLRPFVGVEAATTGKGQMISE